MRRPAEMIEPPRGGAGMGDNESTLLVQRHAVGAGVAAAHLDEQADLARHAVGHQRQPPHGIAAGHADIEHVLRLVHDQAVGAGHGVDQHRELARRVVAIDAAGRIVQAGLALVGEVEIAIGGEEEIVDALEALGAAMVDHRRHLAARGIEQDDAALVVGDEDTTVLVDFQPVRPAVVFSDEGPLARRADAEHAAERNVGHVKIAGTIEAGSLEEGIEHLADGIGIAPRSAAGFAELIRQPRKLGRRNGFGHSVHCIDALFMKPPSTTTSC